MSKINFAKYRERLGYDPNNKAYCDNALIGVTPDTESSELYNHQIPKYENNAGFLGGNRAYVESDGILIIFYKSHMFRKTYQGSCFINFNDIKSFKTDSLSVALIFNYGSLWLINPTLSMFNTLQSKLPTKKESSDSFTKYTKYMNSLELKTSNKPHPNDIRP